MAVSFGTQDWIEAGVIAALVILNVSGQSGSRPSSVARELDPKRPELGNAWHVLTPRADRPTLSVFGPTVGFTQEWKAEKTVAALASVGSPTATVIRHEGGGAKGADGQTSTIQVEEVVPYVHQAISLLHARLVD